MSTSSSISDFSSSSSDDLPVSVQHYLPDLESYPKPKPTNRKTKIVTAALVLLAVGISLGLLFWYKLDDASQKKNSLPLADFLVQVNSVLSQCARESALADWLYATDITQAHADASSNASLAYSSNVLEFAKTAKENAYLKNPNITSEQLRQLNLLELEMGGICSDPKEREMRTKVINEMQDIYSTRQYKGQHLDPELTHIMATARDYDLLLDTWKGWRDTVGPDIGKLFPEYVRLSNTGAKDNGYHDAGTLWRSGYDMTIDQFDSMISSLWNQVLPLYKELHCHVASKLSDLYGKEHFTSGYIPAHLLGNMWAQDWSNIYDIVAPFPSVPSFNITQALIDQHYDVIKVHKTAEDFFVSLGYDPLPATYWTESMLTRPAGRSVVCHASAWDFGNDDIRIKMCTSINAEDFFVVHHEQGHLYYYHHYRSLPYLFRRGANDGFHESIGDVIQLSVHPPHHLQEIGLLPTNSAQKNSTEIEADLLNYQMRLALEKVAFLPFGYLIDNWRWKAFSQSLSPQQYNEGWWELRRLYQGIDSPVPRNSSDFDPGAKYHVAADVPYIRYFLANIYQFEFHKYLCLEANQTPLHYCSIYKNASAGKKFASMLSLGASQPWQLAMAQVTGKKELSADAVLEYFKPLFDWLKKENGKRTCLWPLK